MRLMLHYRGRLLANGPPNHKHEIREHFHSQLKQLWNQKPLSEQTRLLEPDNRPCLLRPRGPFVFVPLISETMDVVAELQITILRPERPGSLITQGGDIDSRLKTLFDALAMPRHDNALPSKFNAPEKHFFCLLEDDNLVTAISLRTEQLLESVEDRNLVDASIHVSTRVSRESWANVSWVM